MRLLLAVLILCTGAVASAATTQPARKGLATTRKSAADAEIILNNLLAPRPEEEPLEPVPDEKGREPIANPQLSGGIIYDRIGRLNRTNDGRWEFRFESDGAALLDPPLIALESGKLETMENIDRKSSGHARFRITGLRTVYKGKGYILIEKFLVSGTPKTAQD